MQEAMLWERLYYTLGVINTSVYSHLWH